jgi:hypothetical protein
LGCSEFTIKSPINHADPGKTVTVIPELITQTLPVKPLGLFTSEEIVVLLVMGVATSVKLESSCCVTSKVSAETIVSAVTGDITFIVFEKSIAVS